MLGSLPESLADFGHRLIIGNLKPRIRIFWTTVEEATSSTLDNLVDLHGDARFFQFTASFLVGRLVLINQFAELDIADMTSYFTRPTRQNIIFAPNSIVRATLFLWINSGGWVVGFWRRLLLLLLLPLIKRELSLLRWSAIRTCRLPQGSQCLGNRALLFHATHGWKIHWGSIERYLFGNNKEPKAEFWRWTTSLPVVENWLVKLCFFVFFTV